MNPASRRLATPIPFAEYTRDLSERAGRNDDVQGIVLLGSSSNAAATRRDEWSDHDFYTLFTPGTEADLRRTLPFLPQPDRIVLIAREGGDGCAVLYDDGHLLEFGAGTIAELGAVKFGDHELLVADDEVSKWAAEAAGRGASFTPESAADAAGLALVKLMIGFGRAMRGEVISGSAFVRGHAVFYLKLAIRQRVSTSLSHSDPFDPSRRFEIDYPDISRRIADALEAPVVDSARQLLSILRSDLEDGWPDFPTAAADIVAERFT